MPVWYEVITFIECDNCRKKDEVSGENKLPQIPEELLQTAHDMGYELDSQLRLLCWECTEQKDHCNTCMYRWAKDSPKKEGFCYMFENGAMNCKQWKAGKAMFMSGGKL